MNLFHLSILETPLPRLLPKCPTVIAWKQKGTRDILFLRVQNHLCHKPTHPLTCLFLHTAMTQQSLWLKTLLYLLQQQCEELHMKQNSRIKIFHWTDCIMDKIFKNIETVKFTTTALKSTLNLVNCKVWLQNVEKYDPVKFENFVYFCITLGKIDAIKQSNPSTSTSKEVTQSLNGFLFCLQFFFLCFLLF